MADVTITVTSGAQQHSVTIPDAAVQRMIPMIQNDYRAFFLGEDPTLMQLFMAGIRFYLKRDTLRYERRTFEPPPIDIGPEEK